MEWININDWIPSLGTFIIAFRDPYPSFYWMGEYKGVPNEDEDLFTHWMEIPDPRKVNGMD